MSADPTAHVTPLPLIGSRLKYCVCGMHARCARPAINQVTGKTLYNLKGLATDGTVFFITDYKFLFLQYTVMPIFNIYAL